MIVDSSGLIGRLRCFIVVFLMPLPQGGIDYFTGPRLAKSKRKDDLGNGGTMPFLSIVNFNNSNYSIFIYFTTNSSSHSVSMLSTSDSNFPSFFFWYCPLLILVCFHVQARHDSKMSSLEWGFLAFMKLITRYENIFILFKVISNSTSDNWYSYIISLIQLLKSSQVTIYQQCSHIYR